MPIVAQPRSAGFPFTFVPKGVFALKANKGVLGDEPLAEGLHWLAPWEYVAYCISPNYTMVCCLFNILLL